MKILFVEWDCYGKSDMKEALQKEGHELILFPFEVSYSHTYGRYMDDPETQNRMQDVLHKKIPDIVFSIDYFPVISKACQAEDIKYISWNYDCPHMLLYSSTVINSCNKIYVFDKKVYREFRDAGITTVSYMPLAVNTSRLDAIDCVDSPPLPFMYDVSFVGALYLEKNNSLFDIIEQDLPDRTKGYLKAMIAVQLKILGYDLIEEMIDAIVDDLYQAFPILPEPDLMIPRNYFYGGAIRQRVTAIERIELLEAIAEKHKVDFFTHIKNFMIPNVCVHGAVNYDLEMPLVFKQSKINLNITFRNIKSGIPLRAFDIMGAGGFLLSDPQADFFDLFVPGEDFVYYTNKADLLQKIEYYLKHEEERQAIAANGHDKVAAGHTYRHRVREMLDF